jgi:hypothetical protein
MFIKNKQEGGLKLTNLSKMLISVLTIVSFVVGAVFFMEDRYFSAASAREMKKEMEADTVKTFKMQQKILEMKQKEQERTMDMRFLEQLQCQNALVEKELKRDPNDTFLQDKKRRIKDMIEKLENKLYGG